MHPELEDFMLERMTQGMAKKKAQPLPPEDVAEIEVLPGIPIHVIPSENFNGAEELREHRWPQLAAVAPIIGDVIQAVHPVGAGAVVAGRGHCMTDAGPVLLLYVHPADE